jgi:hypothetical protein
MLRTVGLGSALVVSIVLLAAGPAAAAPSEKASCVATIVVPLATSGQLDVNDFKALARQAGAPTFGAFVAGGARQHLGSPQACLP